MNDRNEKNRQIKETIKNLLADAIVVAVVVAVIVGVSLLPIWGHAPESSSGSTLIMTHLLRQMSGKTGFGF